MTTRQILLDTETTGIDHHHHRIIEIAGIELIDRRITGKTFHRYVNPQRDIDPQAQAVHGISLEFLLDKPLENDIIDDFIIFITDADLIIHNANFDIGFLNSTLSRCHKKPITDYCHRVIDTLSMARNLFPGKRNSLDALCERFKISLEKRTKHSALIDVELLAEVYLMMTRGQENLDIQTNVPLPSDYKANQKREPILISISDEDRRQHNEVIAHISKKCPAIWCEEDNNNIPS